VARLLRAASAERVAVTFRTAGTSLSGQALTDSVLIYLAGHWRGARVHPGADFVSLEPGVIGAEANFQLAPTAANRTGPGLHQRLHDRRHRGQQLLGHVLRHGRKQLQDRGLLKLVFIDGEALDTADPVSRRHFAVTQEPLDELAAIRPKSWPTPT